MKTWPAVELFCEGGGAVVCARGWLPEEPFDFAWGRHKIGCNRLRCGRCGRDVAAVVIEERREYRCECSRLAPPEDELSAGGEPQRCFVPGWRCAGHPALSFPVILDGIALSSIGDYEEIVRRTIARPPFLAPGARERTFWVERLYHLMPTEAQRARVGRAIGALLSSTEAVLVRAALDALWAISYAHGGAELLLAAERHGARLRALADPRQPRRTLYDGVVSAARDWLRAAARGGRAGATAIEELRRAALAGGAGGASGEAVALLAQVDPGWFEAHAPAIVRAAPGALAQVLEALLASPGPRGSVRSS